MVNDILFDYKLLAKKPILEYIVTRVTVRCLLNYCNKKNNYSLREFIAENKIVDNVTKHVVFIGQVQGVGFRFTALNVATRYELKGYVRNLPDGSVEMLAQGMNEDIDDCVRDIVESFSGYIRETRIDPVENKERLSDFKITF